MKYTGITTKNGKTFVRNRESIFDNYDPRESKFKKFTDHKEMKTWEYAAFQKEQFNEIKRRRRHFWKLLIISTLLAIIIISLVPTITDWLYRFQQSSYNLYR